MYKQIPTYMEDPTTPRGDTTVINLSIGTKAPAYPKITKNKAGGWVAFGDKNMFPQDIIQLNSKSPVNSSIIASKVTYICGKGVNDGAKSGTKFIGQPNTGETWDDFIEPIAVDYETFGGFYWQIIVDKGSTTVSMFHQDFSTVRIGEVDEKGEPINWRISYDWSKTSGVNKPIVLPAWPGSISKAKKGVAYLYNYWDYAPGLRYYCMPSYFPAIEYVRADGTLGVYYNNSIEAGFTPSVVISMPSNPDELKKAAFQKQMENAFAGAKGASSIVILWGENDAVKPSITPYNASANADIYNNVEGIVFQKIVSAHRLSSPTLAGVSGSGNLSGNAAELIDAYVLFNYTVIEKRRRKIVDKINMFQRINGRAAIVIQELDVLPKIRETDTGEPDTGEPATLTRKKNRFKEMFTKMFK